MKLNSNETNFVKNTDYNNHIVHRTKDKRISRVDKNLKTRTKDYATPSLKTVSNKMNEPNHVHQQMLEKEFYSNLILRHQPESEPPHLQRRFRRQASSQNVFHHNRTNHDFFQSSASIKVMSPLDGDSGMFSPEMDYPDSSFYELVTEMSDKEFESLGFPVSPKPTDSYRLSGNEHDYGLIGSLGEHYDTDTGGFSGIEIISRELPYCIESDRLQSDCPKSYYIFKIIS